MLIFLLAFGVFANSLGNGFVYDDVGIIAQNPRLESPWDVRTFFSTSYWGNFLPNSRLYRPLTIMSLAVDRAVFGPGPFGVHLMNVLANAVAAVLVYTLVRRLVPGRIVALLTALLFAAHPVHTEVVANGVGRAELYAVVAMLAAMHLHLSYVHRAVDRGQRVEGRRRSGRDKLPSGRLYLAAAVVLYLVALLLKESAVVLPGLLFLTEWLVVRRGALRPMLPRLGGYLLFVLPLAAYMAARVPVVGTEPPAVQEVMLGATGVQRVLYASETMLRYVGQLAFPLWLCAEYSDYTNLIRSSIAQPLVLASLLVWVGCTVLAVWLVRRKQYLLLYALGWFFLTLLPVSNLVIPVGTIRADRLLFFPSLGFVLAVAWLLVELTRRKKHVGIALFVVVLGFYGWRTWTRNWDWASQDTLWEVTVADNPGSAVAWLALGHGHRLREEFDLAEEAYTRACELRDGAGFFYADAHFHRATLARERGDRAGAAEQYRLIVAERPHNREALMNLGELLVRDAATRHEAIGFLKRAIAELPEDFRGHANLAQAYQLEGQLDLALAAVEEAIQRRPDEARLWVFKANTLRRTGRPAEAQAARAEADRLRGP